MAEKTSSVKFDLNKGITNHITDLAIWLIKDSAMKVSMKDVEYIAFADRSAAKEVKDDYGGCLFVPDNPDQPVVWFPRATLTKIMNHPACPGNGAIE